MSESNTPLSAPYQAIHNRWLIGSVVVLLSALTVLFIHMSSNEFEPLTARDECISNTRGIAEMNAAKQGFSVVMLDRGEYKIKSDGSVLCKATFKLSKDGSSILSEEYSSEVAER